MPKDSSPGATRVLQLSVSVVWQIEVPGQVPVSGPEHMRTQ